MLRKVARLTIYKDDLGRLQVRDQSHQLLTLEDIYRLVEEVRQNEYHPPDITDRERDLLTEHVNLWSHERGAGYVYILKASNGLYKIGHTESLNVRINKLRHTYEYQFELIHVIEAFSRYRVERYLHERFADKRVKQEWFALTDDDVKTLMQFKRMYT
jgi:hypothetical protein